MESRFNRREFCATASAPMLLSLLPGCGGGRYETAAPAHWADVSMRATALAPAPGLPPFLSARAQAIAFLAAHNALNAIDPLYAPSLPTDKAPGANADAAVATAIHDVLVRQLPFAVTFLDAEYASAMDTLQGDGSRPKGIEVGQRCAAAMLAARADDGLARINGPYVQGTTPGAYRFIPPQTGAAGVHFGTEMRPFSIANGAAYRAPAPYSVTDAAYTADYEEVKALGAAVGSTRTADQSEVARFWLENTNDSWARIAIQLAATHAVPGWALMRALALIQMAQCDAYIACFESKYHYNFWRPMTAIRLGDSDGNAQTAGDPAWTSFTFPCPPIPEYPSGHAASGGAGEAVLTALFGRDDMAFTHRSVSLPGPTRHFTRFSQAALEIALSRIYVGFHFRLAVVAGLAQGREVGQQVVATRLPRVG